MKPRSLLLLAFTLTCSALFSQSQRYTPDRNARAVLDLLSPHALFGHIRILSSDLFEGRAPSTRGDKLAQTYIAAQMEVAGLKPAGDAGTYIQRFPIVSLTADPSLAPTFKTIHDTLTLAYGKEFVGTSGKQQQRVEVRDAEVVFVGYGIEAPEQKWNDYKDVDVRGKVLLFLNNDPPSDDPRFFGGKARTYYGRWTYKYEIAAQKGAAGAIIIHTTESAGYGWNVVENSWTGEQFELARDPSTPATLLNGWITQGVAERLLKLSGHTLDALMKSAERRDFKPVPLDMTLSAGVTTAIKASETANVIGVLPGNDPALQNEAIVFTAHFDHLGITKPVNGDSINNGALDNATGVSAILNLARMFSSLKQKPKRTLVFAAVGAEESGTLGSQYFVEHPIVPLAKIAADVNIDGINIFGKTKDIVMVGYGKSTIDEIVRRVAGWQHRTVKPDQFPEQGSFYRSDQYNFARVGIPCLYLDSGVEFIGKPADFALKKVNEYIEKHYHQPSDEMRDDWDLSGAVEDLQLTFLVAYEIANAKEMPAWTKGDEFEAARLRLTGK
jgi:Zn-dependent M28 family amino/carboxypeptidase